LTCGSSCQGLSVLAEYRRVLDVLREAEALSARRDDRRRLGLVYGYTAQLRCMIIDYEPAVEMGQRALTTATELGDFLLGADTRSAAEGSLSPYDSHALDCGRVLHRLNQLE
jgi:hypothetical protein